MPSAAFVFLQKSEAAKTKALAPTWFDVITAANYAFPLWFCSSSEHRA